MRVKHDYSYISDNEKKLIDAGYGKITIHSIHFDIYYTEEQKEKNRQLAETMTNAECGKHCEEIRKCFNKPMHDILNVFDEKYDIHQVTEEKSTFEHYNSNWDMFFWCNNREYMNYFKLNFNYNRSVEKNNSLLEEVLNIVEAMNYDDIACRVQYDALLDKERVERECDEICEKLLNKFITYSGIVGKIKVVDEYNGRKQYGFFKKNARNKYYRINSIKLLCMEM